MRIVAVIVLVLGLISIDSGLTLAGWPYSVSNLRMAAAELKPGSGRGRELSRWRNRQRSRNAAQLRRRRQTGTESEAGAGHRISRSGKHGRPGRVRQ